MVEQMHKEIGKIKKKKYNKCSLKDVKKFIFLTML